jgi:preprotein translocase subunit SecG
LETVIWIFHMLAALALIGFILIQHGKGADVGAAFGAGASGSVFGARGSANFLSRTTAILAVVFFATSLILTYVSSQRQDRKGVMERAVTETPATPATAPAPATVQVPLPAGSADSADSKAKEIPK